MIELTDEILGAYLDGALSPTDVAQVEAALASSPDERVRLEAIRGADQSLRQAFPLPVTRLDDPVVRQIRAATLVRPVLPFRLPALAALSAMAAGLAGLIAGHLLPTTGSTTDSLMASAQLSRALSTQPSGATQDGVDMILTFKTADATPCRQFSVSSAKAGGEGVACFERDAWRVVAWARSTGAASEAYHTAGANAVIDDVVDQMDATGALGATDENALMHQRWRPATR